MWSTKGGLVGNRRKDREGGRNTEPKMLANQFTKTCTTVFLTQSVA